MRLLILTLLYSLIANFSYSQKLPPLNKKIIDYTATKIGQRIDRGECWDLANRALEYAHAKWDHKYVYGRKINTKKEQLLPGDLLQFYNVKLEYKKGNRIFTETMKIHTAVIYKIKKNGTLVLAHQNVSSIPGKKIGLSDFDPKTRIKGKIYYYRPIK